MCGKPKAPNIPPPPPPPPPADKPVSNVEYDPSTSPKKKKGKGRSELVRDAVNTGGGGASLRL